MLNSHGHTGFFVCLFVGVLFVLVGLFLCVCVRGFPCLFSFFCIVNTWIQVQLILCTLKKPNQVSNNSQTSLQSNTFNVHCSSKMS